MFQSEKSWVPHHYKMREYKFSKSVVALYSSRGVDSMQASSKGKRKLDI